MEWLLSLLPWPLYYATVISFALSCLYLFGSDARRFLDRLAERRLQLQQQQQLAGAAGSGGGSGSCDFGGAVRDAAEDAIYPTKSGSSLTRHRPPLPDRPQVPGADGNFFYLGKNGKWKLGQVQIDSRRQSVVLKKTHAVKPLEAKKAQKTVPLESLHRIALEAADEGDAQDSVIVGLHADSTKLTLRIRAADAGKWLQSLQEELLVIRPKLAVGRPPISEECITEKLKLVCELEAPSFSIDLLVLLLREFGIFAKRTDLKNHLQQKISGTSGKVKVETYRETVDAVKEIMGYMDGHEIFKRYTMNHSNGNLISVADFHRKFVASTQGLQHSLPETVALLRSIAVTDADLLDLLLISRGVFKSVLTSKAFTLPLKLDQLELKHPLSLPLTDYFISTSHNTYLMEDQIKGRSDCLAYEIALKKNCRCVELDIHNGPNNDPIITHGGTMTSRIRFEDVIKTIRRFAFVASEYPLILSFENHCGLEQQDRMAQILSTHLKDYIYLDENSDRMDQLPCPEELKRKIVIKNKKHQSDKASFSAFYGPTSDAADGVEDESDDESDVEVQMASSGRRSFTSFTSDASPTPPPAEEDAATVAAVAASSSAEQLPEMQPSPPSSDFNLSRRYSSDKPMRDGQAMGKKRKKVKVSQSLSNLVCICRPVKFKGQKFAKENYRPVEMSSLTESKMEKRQWVRKDGEDANKLVLHTQYQLLRIYPSGLRTNSSNYNPTVAWRFGCQLVALNYQTRCENMEINDGLFQLNGACGYVPKPAILTEPGTKFNPFSPAPGLARCLRLEVVSGANLRLPGGKEREAEEKGSSPYVKLTLFGVPGDEKKDQTKKADQGFHPRWNCQCFEDNRLVKVPDLAHLRLEVKDKNSGKIIGQFTAPLTAFSKGYRRIFLKDTKDMPTASELWIKFKLGMP